MSKKTAKEPRSRQLLLRLTEADGEVLDAAGHLHGQTANAYAYGLLTGHVERLRKDPYVLRDLANRRGFEQASQHTVLLDMPPRTEDGEAPKDSGSASS